MADFSFAAESLQPCPSTAKRRNRIDRPHNPITRPRRDRANRQRLRRTPRGIAMRSAREQRLCVAEGEQDDEGNADGDEERVHDVAEREVGDHGEQSAQEVGEAHY
ncbi:hypothetical protein M8818_005320 [Zalaria obscura]|uniref:Uncharacterized protein n=1 Tax=Zalaria obscura TaxID=2024903 RepID=A0ACC3S988_9PEZI